MDWIKSSVLNSQKVTLIDTWKRMEATMDRCYDYNNQDEDNSSSILMYKKVVFIQNQIIVAGMTVKELGSDNKDSNDLPYCHHKRACHCLMFGALM